MRALPTSSRRTLDRVFITFQASYSNRWYCAVLSRALSTQFRPYYSSHISRLPSIMTSNTNSRRRSLSWKLPANIMKKPGFVKNLQTSPKSEMAAAVLTRGEGDAKSGGSQVDGNSNGSTPAAHASAMNGRYVPDTQRRHSSSQSSSIGSNNAVYSCSADFRSDTVTVPTQSMLDSITSIAVHGDDVYREDRTTTDLENRLAELTGKDAGLFVLSGTMANQLSLRTLLTQPPHSILTDARSHVCNYEAGGAQVLSQAGITPVTPSNGAYMTLEDVQAAAVLTTDIHFAPTRVISLENSINGAIVPLKEVRRISKWAKENGIKMHLDGARLWNVVVAGAGSLADYCKEFDMCSLCFSKGLGAPMGSIIVGNKDLVEKARWFRKMVGGGTRQSGVVTGPARVAVEEVFLGGGLERSHKLAKRVEETWKSLGGKVEFPCQTNMVFLDLNAAGITDMELIDAAEAVGVKLQGGRVVVHHQISDEAIEKLENVLGDLTKKAVGRAPITGGDGNRYGPKK